jgi:carbon monoxide dehydrogenase subunit G
MELSHNFTVPIGVEETWAHFNDIASVAECFPGAQVTEADEDSFSGSVKVKLGPIALQYNGSGTFVEKDAEAHRFVVDAKGKDKRGNGTAGAKVTVSMADAGGSTDVSVETDLSVTGKPAQFGRGVMQDVSDKLLGQFVACLEQRLAGPAEASAAPSPAEPSPTEPSPTDASPAEASAGPSVDEVLPSPPPGPAQPAPRHAAAPPPPPHEPEALDLGSAVLPVLAKSYWRQALAVVVVLVVLRRLLRRS